MKKFILPVLLIGVALLFGGQTAVGPPNLISCNKVANVSPSTAGTLAIIAPATGVVVSICGWHVTSAQAASTTFQLEYGTGATCGTGTNTFTPAFSVTSTAPSADRQQTAYYSLPISNGLCVVTTGSTVTQAVMVWYSTFP